MIDRKIELPEGVPFLNTYYVYLTGGCNLACQHCWIAPTYQANGGTGGHLDYDLLALAIEEGLPLGLSRVKLTGGEPLLHPDFIQIVDLIREKELYLTIETNGTLVTESLAHYLKEKSTLDHVSISLDGATAATHDAFRGVKGSFDKAVQGLRYLVEAGFQPQVIMSLHSGNVDEIEALVRLAESAGASSVKFNLIQPTGRGETLERRGKILEFEQQLRTGHWVENILQKQVSIRLVYSWPMAFHSLRRLTKGGLDVCGVFGILGILYSGHLALCGIGEHVPELCYGQLGQDPVGEVWVSNPALLNLRESFFKDSEGICARCLFQNRCMGHCVAETYMRTKRLTAPYEFCQTAAQNGYFPISRLRALDKK